MSVTDRCNFRCQYCMPAEGLTWLDRYQVLTFEEIERLVALLAEMGITDLRLTGGEPLVRRDFPVLAGMLARVPGLKDLSLTTNGYLLQRHARALADAGVRRINVSIDSLQRERFFETLQKRLAHPTSSQSHDRVQSLRACLQVAQFRPGERRTRRRFGSGDFVGHVDAN